MNNQTLRTVLLSCLSGFVDTAVFVFMGGLFVAHVTGNFVLLGATLSGQTIGGAHGQVAMLQLLSFPVFVVAAGLATVLAEKLPIAGRPTGLLFALSALMFAAVGGLSFAGWSYPVPGSMVLVAAMGVLNAAHRLDPTLGPPFTVMTGNITGLAVALARGTAGNRATLLASFSPILGFLLGCAAGALLQAPLGLGAMVVPAVLMLGALLADRRVKRAGDGTVKAAG
jgi:uncharacterized membrane protein YoaK (UPF0700 family)